MTKRGRLLELSHKLRSKMSSCQIQGEQAAFVEDMQIRMKQTPLCYVYCKQLTPQRSANPNSIVQLVLLTGMPVPFGLPNWITDASYDIHCHQIIVVIVKVCTDLWFEMKIIEKLNKSKILSKIFMEFIIQCKLLYYCSMTVVSWDKWFHPFCNIVV